MRYVYVIAMYSTGERWHTAVCETSQGAARVLNDRGMTREYGNDDSEYQDYRNPADISQTANVQRVFLLP